MYKFLTDTCGCYYCELSPLPNVYRCNSRLFWIDIPRCGSSSMKGTFTWKFVNFVNELPDNPHEGDLYCTVNADPPEISHINDRGLWVVNDLNASKIKPIVIYRNPVDRFIGLIDHYFNGMDGRCEYGTDWFRDILGLTVQDIDPIDRVQLVMENLDKLHLVGQKHHFYLQRRYLENCFFEEFTYISLNQLSNLLPVDHQHPSISVITKDMFTLEHKKHIEEIYYQDYEYFHLKKEYNT